jgi:hypothetical protein
MVWPIHAEAALKIWSDRFQDGNTTNWTITNSGATIALDNTTGNDGLGSLKVTGNAGGGQWATALGKSIPVDFTRDYTVQCAFRYDDFHWDQFFIFGHIRLLIDTPANVMLYDPVGNCSYAGSPVSGNSFQSYLAAGVFGWITVHCRPAVRQYSVFINGVRVGTVAYQPGLVPTQQFYFEDNPAGSNHLTAWYDDFSVWGFQTPQQYANPCQVTDPENTAMWAQPPNVPFHGQYTIAGNPPPPLSEPCCPAAPNGRCAVACMHMIFDRFGDVLPPAPPGPQEEIECAANTNDRVHWPNGLWNGTSISDIRRAAHFSAGTQSLTNVRPGCPPAGQPGQPGIWGYTWRDRGFAVVDSVWTDLAPGDSVDAAQTIAPTVLETFVGSGYPLMVFIDITNYLHWLKPDANYGEVDTTTNQPEQLRQGHAIMLIGFDNSPNGACPGNMWGQPAFMIHDPAVARYGWIPQRAFWMQVWLSKRFVFAAPWEVMWLQPPVLWYGGCYEGTALVTYPGAPPLDGFYLVANARARVTLTNIGLQGGEVQTHNLANLVDTGDWDFATWKLQCAAAGQGIVSGTVKPFAFGTLNPAVSSTSYQNYADLLGGRTSVTELFAGGIIPHPPRPGFSGHPYGQDWWRAGPGGSHIYMLPVGGSVTELYATIANHGEQPIPAGTMCRFYYEDPNLAEHAPGGTSIGALSVPPLAYGDTLMVGPLTWTMPPQNGFGQPFFSIFGALECVDDPPASNWPQDEDNYATLSEQRFATDEGTPVSLDFWVRNPEPVLMEMVLGVECIGEASHWDVGLSLPVGEHIVLPPGGSLPCQALVTPTSGGVGEVHVLGFLYYPGGALVRETGGVAMIVEAEEESGVPGDVAGLTLVLAPSRPNPLGPRGSRATIAFAIPTEETVDLRLFDVGGRLVRTFYAGRCPAGLHEIAWEGNDDRGLPVSNGVYFYRLEYGHGRPLSHRIVVMR